MASLEARGADVPIPELAAGLDADSAELLDELLAGGPTGSDLRRVIDDSLAALRVRDLSDRLAEIDRLVALGVGEEQRP